MTVLKRAGLIVMALIVIMLVTIALLSMTRGTPVHSVLVPGTMGLPPAVSDPLYSRTVELFAKTPLGNAMTAMFFSDLEHSVEIKLETFARRPFTERMWEAGANLLSRLL